MYQTIIWSAAMSKYGDTTPVSIWILWLMAKGTFSVCDANPNKHAITSLKRTRTGPMHLTLVWFRPTAGQIWNVYREVPYTPLSQNVWCCIGLKPALLTHLYSIIVNYKLIWILKNAQCWESGITWFYDLDIPMDQFMKLNIVYHTLQGSPSWHLDSWSIW